MNLEKLIAFVRDSDVLYNSVNKEYRNLEARAEAWNEIGLKLSFSGNECKETWNKLRNSHTNALKRRKIAAGHQTAKNIPNWKYEEQMAFLLPNLQCRNKSLQNVNLHTYFETEDDPLNMCETVDNTYVEEIPGSDHHDNGPGGPSPPHSLDLYQQQQPAQTTPQPSISNVHSHPIPRPRHGQRRLLDGEMVKIKEENNGARSQVYPQMSSGYEQQVQHVNFASDETELFFLSLGKSVKKLRPEEQAMVKMEVSNIVFQAELRNLQRDNHATSNHVTSNPAVSHH